MRVRVVLWALLCISRHALADAGGPPASHHPDPADAIRAFIEGRLSATTEPQSLFDVPLDDPAALELEAARLRVLLPAVHTHTTSRAAMGPPAPAPDGLEAETWRRRIEVDRARLDFYRRPTAERSAIIDAHRARQREAAPTETESERRAREVAAQQAAARELAARARSEGERLVAEELSRLAGIDAELAQLAERRAAVREELTRRRDTILGWQRRARDAALAGPSEADRVYPALRDALRRGRDDLDRALDDLAASPEGPLSLGPDPLGDLPAEVDVARAAELRAGVGRRQSEAMADIARLRQERAALLLDEVDSLNRERLALLLALSDARRGAITGFGPDAWDQARAEARHLLLILRYHRHVVLGWIRDASAGTLGGRQGWRLGAVVLPIVLILAGYAWLRRRTPALFAALERRLSEAERSERRVTPSRARWALRFLGRVRRQLEVALLVLALGWSLPVEAWRLLEVQLIASIASWVVFGRLAVVVVDALASDLSAPARAREVSQASSLRLRSLRLVAATVVALGVFLLCTDRLVGQGTVYRWAVVLCWVAGAPVFLILVRWWRPIIHQRMAQVRRPSALQRWVVAQQTGWASFPAAMVGAVDLFGSGTYRRIRGWVATFDLTRRAHAYLFKREIDRLDQGHEGGPTRRPLDEARRSALHPESRSDFHSSSGADQALAERVARRSGVVAVVGARGMGKSTALRRLGSSVLTCRGRTSADDIRETVRNLEGPVLLDEVEALVKPTIGGLTVFDQILSLARADKQRTWVMALDATVWPFLLRVRDDRPLFDDVIRLEPWSEERLGALLRARSEQAGLQVRFDDLLDQLPPGADDEERAQALWARQVGYIRMLWDHVRGNPGLALELWRSSLAVDEGGGVHARALQLPDASPLETLPDGALFLLRAVLQLEPATLEDLARVAHLPLARVVDSVRFGESVGFYIMDDTGVRVTWRWLRPVLGILERRHLLVPS